MSPHRRYATVVGVFATVLYLALVVCAFGFISLLTDTEVIEQQQAGVALGPSMVGGAVLVVLIALVLRVPRIDFAERRSAPLFAVLTGVIAGVAYAVVGGVGFGIGSGSLLAGAPFIAATAVGPYGVSVVILAALVVWLDTFVVAARFDDRGRPRWAWEDEYDE
ncbi:DUF6121 family protein [Agromyces atrinae]|uniref:DUF6121 family protein n=1 Tax=Agromyces atrinae TaxID=592376 RepID=UPI001F5A6E7E|nr:DUF6121 family protein [Agromyces atrinae]MCI2957799.1 DUF6121 family protein [Agromyces atrinae]